MDGHIASILFLATSPESTFILCPRRLGHQVGKKLATVLAVGLVLSGCASSGSPLKFISAPDAPRAAGPYSQGVVAGGMLYTAGITPRDPTTGSPTQGDITVQTNRVIDSLEAILRGAGCSIKDVVKVTVYLADVADFGKMNEVMSARFGHHKPARSTLQAGKLPGGAALEIDFVARVP